MDFARSYFFTHETLGSWKRPWQKIDSPVIKTLERQFSELSEWVSNVLITGESNFDEENVQLPRSSQSCILGDIKFTLSEKATKFEGISPLVFTICAK